MQETAYGSRGLLQGGRGPDAGPPVHALDHPLAGRPERHPDGTAEDDGWILTFVGDQSTDTSALVVLDATGRTYTGMMTAQTATSVTLQREKGAADTLLRANIDEIASTGKSMMPEGLEKSITVEQMADLLSYLQQARAPAVGEEDLPTRDFGTLPGLSEPPKPSFHP